MGEGQADTDFFSSLCKQRQILGFQFEHAGSKDKFIEVFDAIKGRRGHRQLKVMLVVGDSDDKPDKQFLNIKNQLKAAKFPQPNNHMEVATRPNHFAVEVLMLPHNNVGPTKGCLETLLLIAARAKYKGIVHCVEDFKKCIGIHAWTSQTAIDKLCLRLILSGSWQKDPNLSLPSALKKNLIPMDHSCFDTLAKYLAGFHQRFG